MIYKPQYFRLEEVLPKYFFTGNEQLADNLWLMFDKRILITADKLRYIYGKMVCNTWLWGGSHEYRGWRPFHANTGSFLSQHKFGRALDLFPVHATVDEIRQDILSNSYTYEFRFITGLELNVNWLHIDCRNWDKENHGVKTFYA